jgi:hypothetical protein
MIGALLSIIWDWLSKRPEVKILIGKCVLRIVMFFQGFRFKHHDLVVKELLRNADRRGGLFLNEASFQLGVMLTDRKVRILPLRKYVFWGPVLEYKIRSMFSPPYKLSREQLEDWLHGYVKRAEALKSFGLRRAVAPMLKAPQAA